MTVETTHKVFKCLSVAYDFELKDINGNVISKGRTVSLYGFDFAAYGNKSGYQAYCEHYGHYHPSFCKGV